MTDISRKAVSSAIFDPGATESYRGERTLTEWQTDAVMRALQASLDAAEGRVTVKPRCAECTCTDGNCNWIKTTAPSDKKGK